MADPATLLHDQLSAWSKADTLSVVRNLNTEEGWRKQRIAAVNLDNVLKILDRLDDEGADTSPWRKYTRDLHKAVFGFETDWLKRNDRHPHAPNPVNEHAINSLPMLSMVSKHLVPKLEGGGLQRLQDMLGSEILKKPSMEFPYELRAYFVRVRDHLSWCVENFDEVGEFSLHEAAMQFRMTVQFMAVGAPVGEQSKWWSFVKDTFVWPFISTTVTTGPAELASKGLGEVGQRIMELMSGR